MPKRSDCPYPEVVCSEIHDATTFEHYQSVEACFVNFIGSIDSIGSRLINGERFGTFTEYIGRTLAFRQTDMENLEAIK